MPAKLPKMVERKKAGLCACLPTPSIFTGHRRCGLPPQLPRRLQGVELYFIPGASVTPSTHARKSLFSRFRVIFVQNRFVLLVLEALGLRREPIAHLAKRTDATNGINSGWPVLEDANVRRRLGSLDRLVRQVHYHRSPASSRWASAKYGLL